VAAFSPASTVRRQADAILLRRGLFDLPVGGHQPRRVRVEFEQLDDALGLTPREPREVPPREEVGEFHPQPGVAGRDPFNTCHP
jgi:hypothetical protein